MDELDVLLFSTPYSRLLERMRSYGSLTRFHRLIQTEYVDPSLTLQAAANRCGVSPRHLNRRLVQATGYSYLEFLNRYRLRKALRKMQKGDLTLLEISHAAGFGSLSGFQRQFAAILGRSAREVRKELRQG